MGKIPKIIHYCWVGGKPKPKSVLYCIESWKKYCPDYEIKEWNETNYDFSKNAYMKQAYETKKWGFVPDYARLDIIYQYGGIYLDTDVEVIKNLNPLLDNKSFFGFEDTGENEYFVACGLGFGAQAGNSLIKDLRDYYDNISFFNEDSSLNLTPAPRHNMKVFLKHGVKMNNEYQRVEENVIYPSEYFCPKIFKTGATHKTKNTYSIHQFDASWIDVKIREDIKHNQKVCLRLGDKLGHKYLYVESAWKKYGFGGLLKKPFIQIYEKIYLYNPLITAYIKRLGKKERVDNGITLFDTALFSKNAGDQIIMQNCEYQLGDILDGNKIIRISTHIKPKEELKNLTNLKILCGTNILSCDMRHYGLWKLPEDISELKNIILMGVGFDSYNTKSDLYTRLLLKYMLSSKNMHSVRDSFSENCLKKMGIKNVINTGCPTMWRLTKEHCRNIPTHKSENVICTITDYSENIDIDRTMINILKESYNKIYLWLQGTGDEKYLEKLGVSSNIIVINRTLEDYDEILKNNDLDYVGTRLHAGIRALSAGHRSIIVAIDNRAKSIAKDTNLPIINREDIKLHLKNTINSEFKTEIHLPEENIKNWKEQFRN